LQDYYNKLNQFAELTKNTNWFPHYLILQLVPFGHIMKIWFHASPKEISYLTRLRVRPGGHINYRVLAYLIAEKSGGDDLFTNGLFLGEDKKPDPTSRLEFLDRS
jgi:hypothetical protein